MDGSVNIDRCTEMLWKAEPRGHAAGLDKQPWSPDGRRTNSSIKLILPKSERKE